MNAPINPACRAQHTGIYAIRPAWLMQTLAQIRSGLYVERVRAVGPEAEREAARMPMEVRDGVATIFVAGPMVKGWSKFTPADTMQIRRAVRQARNANDVKGILLLIDSPGGSVAGVQELADEVAVAAKDKPVHAHLDDMGASAAYWVASQANRVTANRTAIVGSIGAFTVLEDTSAMAEGLGVKVHVVASGPMKGGAVDGVPVTAEVLAETQRLVDAVAKDFFGAVTRGRGIKGKALDAITTGEVWTAEEALSLGLLDAVTSSDAAWADLGKAIRKSPTPRRDRAAIDVRMHRIR